MFFGLIITSLIIYTTPACADILRSNDTHTYNKASCKVDYRIIKLEDLQNLTINDFTVATWINASAEYTPWVFYKGIYRNIQQEHILGNTSVISGKQFTTCIQFCSVYKWTYIGLQVHKCYCLSSSASQSAKHNNSYSSKPCRHGYLPQCALDNQDNAMVVYEKDTLNTKVAGECLIAIAINTYSLSSYQPTDCQATKAYAACVTFDRDLRRNTIRFSPGEMERENSLSYCSHYGNVADLDTLNTTELSSRVTKGNYWVSNFRQSLIIKQDYSKINKKRQYCVTAEASQGIIRHKISNCTEKKFFLCIKTGSPTVQGSAQRPQTTMNIKEQQSSTPKSTFSEAEQKESTMNIKEKQSISSKPTSSEAQNDQTTEVIHEQQSITPNSTTDEGSDLLIIIGAVGGCLAVLLLTGIIIALRKRYFQRSDLETQSLSVEYAVVQNERGITYGSEDLRDTDENVNKSEENTYDHTNTSRPLPHSTGGDLYDTMATVQEIVTGEPVYQHSSHRPSTSHEGKSQAADPLYDHMTN